MALDPKAKSQIKHGQAGERAEMNDRHGAQKRQLSHTLEQARKREVEEARKNGGKSDTRLKSDDTSVRDRVKEHAKLKAKHDDEYRDMNKRHTKEMAEAEKSGKVPARYAAGAKDMGGGVLMAPHEGDEYRAIVSKYENKHNVQHNADEARKDRTARYKSSAMTAKLEESRLSHHDEINKKQERELAHFRRKIQSKHQAA